MWQTSPAVSYHSEPPTMSCSSKPSIHSYSRVHRSRTQSATKESSREILASAGGQGERVQTPASFINVRFNFCTYCYSLFKTYHSRIGFPKSFTLWYGGLHIVWRVATQTFTREGIWWFRPRVLMQKSVIKNLSIYDRFDRTLVEFVLSGYASESGTGDMKSHSRRVCVVLSTHNLI